MSTTSELCAERLTPRAMWASTHSRCSAQGPGATLDREGAVGSFSLSYSAPSLPPPPSGYLDRDLS